MTWFESLPHQQEPEIDYLNRHPLTQLLLAQKLANVNADRYLVDGKLNWNQLLTRINSLFPEVLLCNFVCQAKLNEVYTCY